MMKQLLPLAVAIALAGCAVGSTLPDIPEHPSAEWVNEHLPAFRAEAERNPTKENRAAVERLESWADHQGRAQAKMLQINRELTLAWDNMGRGGAAIRQPAYIHVLGDEFNDRYASTADLSDQTGTNEDTVREALARLGELRKEDSPWSQGYSIYEMERWERFCDGGRGMDEPDWTFVTRAGGRRNIPDALASDCRPPSYDYQDYLRAWTRFCDSDNPSRVDRDIVSDSVRPRSVVNPCRALQ